MHCFLSVAVCNFAGFALLVYANSDVLQMFFTVFFCFFRSPQNTRQPFSGTAERIFMKLLPNNSGHNVVSNVVPKWGLGLPNMKKHSKHNTRYRMTQRCFSVVRANVAWCRCRRTHSECSDGPVSHLRMSLPHNAMLASGYYYGGCV